MEVELSISPITIVLVFIALLAGKFCKLTIDDFFNERDRERQRRENHELQDI